MYEPQTCSQVSFTPMKQLLFSRLAPAALLVLVAFFVLWKGGKSVDATWILALFAGAIGCHLAFDRNQSKVMPLSVWWSAILFTLFTIVSFLLSTTKNYGLDEVLHTVSFLIIFTWTHQNASDAFKIVFGKVLAVATLLASGFGVLLYLLQPVTRFVGSFFDYRFHTDYWPNAWAEYLLLAWPLLLWTLLRKEQSKWRHAQLVLIMGFVGAVALLTYSRGALLTFATQIVILLILLVWKKRQELRPRIVVMRSLGIVLVACLFFAGINLVRSHVYPIESITAKASFRSAEGTSSISERSSFFRQSLTLISERPLFGYGPYSFRFVQPKLQTVVLATSDHPHNVFLKFAAERGIATAFFFLFLLLFIAWSLLRAETINWFTLFGSISVLGVLLHNLLDYNLQFIGIALPLWMLLSMLVPRTSVERVQPLFYRLIIGSLSVLLLIVSLTEGYGLLHSSRARHAMKEKNIGVSEQEFSKAEGALFSRDDWLSRSLIALSGEDFQTAESRAEQYTILNNEDARGFRLLGDIYLAWGQKRDALRAYEKAYYRSSRNDLGIARGYATLLRTEEPQKLRDLKPDLDQLIADFAAAIQSNSHFVALSKNVEELEALTIVMARAFPEDATFYRFTATVARENADKERAVYTARPAGLLW